MGPRISVPVHNAARCLEETLAAVFSQTYQSSEVTLVNDHSTDGSTRVP